MPTSDHGSARAPGALSRIPQARRDGVHDALRAAFGSRNIGEMQSILGGASGAPILRFEVGGRPYVMRLEPERVARHHRRRGFACMASAAPAGAAPQVHYADAAAGVVIMDYIAGRPLSEYPGGPMALMRGLGGLIARVQTSTPFPMVGDYPQMIGTMLTALRKSGLLAPNLLNPHADGLARIRAVLPWDASSLVSSHNDPNPRNILFDGERLWLIDWELAFRNDPLVDVAILTIDLAQTPELEDALLAAAFGAPPNRALRARLAVMRLLTRLFYGCVVLESFAQAPRSAPDENLAEFTPASFRAAIADGRFASGSPQLAYAFGKMSLTAFSEGLDAPGFDAMLEMIAQG